MCSTDFHNAPTAPEGTAMAFAPLVFQEWTSLAGLSEPRVVGPRETLYPQEELRNCVWFIERGVVKLARLENDGTEYILGLRSNGWVLDAASTILNRPSPSSAVTLTTCTIRRVPRSQFMHLLETSPSMMQDLNRLMCREIQAEQQQQVEFRSGNAQSRLNRLIQELLQASSSGDPLALLPLRRFEIAQLLAISPEHLSRLLHGNPAIRP